MTYCMEIFFSGFLYLFCYGSGALSSNKGIGKNAPEGANRTRWTVRAVF